MRMPMVILPTVGALLAVATTGLPVVLHGREPDVINLVAGLVLLVAGAHLTAFTQTQKTGRLLVLASIAWFLPDLAPSLPPLATGLSALSLVHVIPIVAAVLVASPGTLERRGARAVIVLACIAAASALTGGYEVLVPAVGAALLLAAMPQVVRANRGLPSAAYAVAVVATTSAFVGVPLARATLEDGRVDWLFAGYAGLLAIAAVALVRVGPWLGSAAVLDVGPDALASLDDLLAAATEDPRAHAVVRLDDGRWIRLDGSPSMPPAEPSGRVAVIAKRPVPSALEATVAEGLRLAADNLRARDLVEARVHELTALRTRLVRVEEDERAALVERLRSGPLATLVTLRKMLTDQNCPEDLVDNVRRTERDLAQVAAGLDPLDGWTSYADALRALAIEMGASTPLELRGGSGDLELGLTEGRVLWFACSEALTNAAKHASDAERSVQLTADGSDVVLVVADEGPGPGPVMDTGLIGVRDRVAAIGGTVRVSHGHPGTRVEVRVPTTRQHLSGSGAAADAAPNASSLTSKQSTMEA